MPRRLSPPQASRLLLALPRRTRGLGTGTPASERPRSGTAPPARSPLRARAGVPARAVGSSHEPGRGSQRSGAARQRCLRCAWRSGRPRAPGPERDAAPAAAAAAGQPAPDHPKVRGEGRGARGLLGHTPGPRFVPSLPALAERPPSRLRWKRCWPSGQGPSHSGQTGEKAGKLFGGNIFLFFRMFYLFLFGMLLDLLNF